MAQLYLPAAHTEADLVLAGQIATSIESAQLYVAWTPEHGQAAPQMAAELRDPAPHWSDTLALLFQAVVELWAVLLRGQPSGAGDTPPSGAPRTAPKPATGDTAA